MFVGLPWRLYRGDLNWVPPLLADIHVTVWGKGSWLQKAGPSEIFLAWPVRACGGGGTGDPGSVTVGGRGPISPSNGDDYRALLVEGFDSPSVLLDSYNPPFYKDYFERYGFTNEMDLWAFHYNEVREMPTHRIYRKPLNEVTKP